MNIIKLPYKIKDNIMYYLCIFGERDVTENIEDFLFKSMDINMLLAKTKELSERESWSISNVPINYDEEDYKEI